MRLRKILLLCGTGIVVYLGMRYLLPLTIPFFVGWIIASKILPAAVWIEKKTSLARGIAGGFLIFLILGIIVIILWKGTVSFLSQFKEIVISLKNMNDHKELYLNNCCGIISMYTGIEEFDIKSFILYYAGKVGKNLQNTMLPMCMKYILGVIKGGAALIAGAVTTVLFGTLVIKDMDCIREKIQKNSFTKNVWETGRKVCVAGGIYLKTQLYLMGIISGICVLGLWIMKNPYFLFSGLVIGVLDMLPILGTGTVLIPWSVIWLVKGEYGTALGYLIIYIVSYLVREFLEPKMLGKKTGIHPALMVIGVYVGFLVYGVSGVVLGPVTLLTIHVIYNEIAGVY